MHGIERSYMQRHCALERKGKLELLNNNSEETDY